MSEQCMNVMKKALALHLNKGEEVASSSGKIWDRMGARHKLYLIGWLIDPLVVFRLIQNIIETLVNR